MMELYLITTLAQMRIGDHHCYFSETRVRKIQNIIFTRPGIIAKLKIEILVRFYLRLAPSTGRSVCVTI